MFYSHEILSNRQYGVATIWLVATIGKENRRRLTKRAIQEVNVPKACETILDPGAPLALRLQGNLLYGVSRVFSQQCGYVLTEAEKTQSDMMTFFRIIQTSDIDPQAGKTKRKNIVLEDDPAFDLLNALPNIDLLKWDKDLVMPQSQGSAADYSHFTPLGSQSASLAGFNSALLNLELPSSSHSAASCRIPSEFGQHSPLLSKTGPNDMPEFQPFGDEELGPTFGVGIEFDADGNLIEIMHQEPELPPLPGVELLSEYRTRIAKSGVGRTGEEFEFGDLALDEDEYLVHLGEPALPDAAAFPSHRVEEARALETVETVPASTKVRARRSKKTNFLDAETSVPRKEMNEWIGQYAVNMEAENARSTKTTSQPQARRNAFMILYGNGIADIGASHGAGGLPHPLAIDFAGEPLRQRLLGEEPAEEADLPTGRRGRRRNSDEAFEGDEEIDQERSPRRQRVDEEAELGRGALHVEDGQVMIDDVSFPEMGMEGAAPLEDRHSSSVMPWSRPGSAVPGSSIRGSAQKPKTAPSPLVGKGSAVRPIDRYSDPAEEPAFDLAEFASRDSSSRFGGSIGPFDLPAEEQASGPLDLASQDFLAFAKTEAVKKGKALRPERHHERWIRFEDLVGPGGHSRAVAAQAFLQVLSLATKGVIAVRQVGETRMQAFGGIQLGMDVAREMREQAELEDELA